MAEQPAAPPSRLELLISRPHHEQFARLRRDLLERLFHGPHRDNYILRGSTVLKHWFPNMAREPNDLDLVATYSHDPERCVREVFASCTDPALSPEVFPIQPGNVLPMWEYDIFPGVRFHVPSDASFRLPTVQLDVAFDNTPELPSEVIRLQSSQTDPPVEVRSWTLTSCLASKLCWIANDCRAGEVPDGSDIRDAVLLAERGEIDAGVLRRIVPEILAAQGKNLTAFDVWDQRVWKGMQVGTTPPTNDPRFAGRQPGCDSRGFLRPDYLAYLEDERNALLRDLQYPLSRLLDGLLWFPTADEWAFLHRTAQNPDDRFVRLVYADWLEDRSDPRGEFLRLHTASTQDLLTDDQNRRWDELSALVPSRWCRLTGIPV